MPGRVMELLILLVVCFGVGFGTVAFSIWVANLATDWGWL